MENIIQHLIDMPWQEWILLVAGPFLFTVYLWAWWRAYKEHRNESFTIKRTVVNFTLGGSYIIFETFAKIAIIVPICLWIYDHSIWKIEVNIWTVLPIFIAVEFCYYWFHRASHRIRWFWTAHVAHHSDEAMNLSTAMRQSILYSVTGWWLFFTPLMFIGVHPIWVFFLYSIDLIYQFFIHTDHIGKYSPWVEFIFNTPSNHRAHHGRNPQYIDKNYGGVLIIFDRLFGTYVKEEEPVEYGVIPPQPSMNPIKIIFHEFIEMWQDVFRQKTWKDRIKQIVMAPENARR